MPAIFESCALKIQRAQEHLVDFNDRILRFYDESPYALEHLRDADSGEWKVVLRVAKQYDATLGIITGEISHHLRSALDYAVGELIEAATGSPPEPNHNFEFPIFLTDRKENARDFDRKTRGVSGEARTILQAIQPYRLERPERSTLALLHVIDIENKHRALHVLYGGAGLRRASHSGLTGAGQFSIPDKWVTNPGVFPAEDGAQVFGFFSANDDPNVQIEVNVYPGFANPAIARGVNVTDFCARAIYRTAEVISQLAETATR